LGSPPTTQGGRRLRTAKAYSPRPAKVSTKFGRSSGHFEKAALRQSKTINELSHFPESRHWPMIEKESKLTRIPSRLLANQETFKLAGHYEYN